MKLAAFNVENLFERAKVLRPRDWDVGRPVLGAFTQLNRILNKTDYTAADRKRILDLLEVLGLLRSDEGPFVYLRRIRGRLVKRHRNGEAEVVASGRDSWVGWIELKTEQMDGLAIEHTALVIREVDADVVGVVEAESRIALKRLVDRIVGPPAAPVYRNVMVIDGNDNRGIDVGIVTKTGFEITQIRSHVEDRGVDGRRIFGRDCPEYLVRTPNGNDVLVLVNHFKSKGYGRPQESNETRRRQAARVAELYAGRRAAGLNLVAVVGDLNDTPTSAPLAPLMTHTDLRDISEHPAFDDGGRVGTYGTAAPGNKIDYVLLSPDLFDATKSGGVFRKGVWTASGKWEMFDTLENELDAASDHAAIWADMAI